MTVPIIPGPFSFLSGAGDVYANYANSKRKRQVEDQTKSRQELQDYVGLVQAGVFPRASLTSPTVMAMFQRAGVELPQGMGVVPSTEERKAGSLAGAPNDVFNASQGIPSPERVGADRNIARAEGSTAGVVAGEMSNVTAGTPQARSVAKVPAAPVAAATEQTQLATEQAKQKAAETDQLINTEVDSRMNSDPDFRRWAAIAKADFLPLYLQRIQSYNSQQSGENSERRERMRLLFLPLDDAARTYREQANKYNEALAKQSASWELLAPEAKAAALEEFNAANPKPNQRTIRAHAIANMAQDLFPGAEPKEAIGQYFNELKRTTGILGKSLPAARLSNIKKAADLVKSTASLPDGDPKKVTVEMARKKIISTATDPTLELLELERILGGFDAEENDAATPPKPEAPKK